MFECVRYYVILLLWEVVRHIILTYFWWNNILLSSDLLLSFNPSQQIPSLRRSWTLRSTSRPWMRLKLVTKTSWDWKAASKSSMTCLLTSPCWLRTRYTRNNSTRLKFIVLGVPWQLNSHTGCPLISCWFNSSHRPSFHVIPLWFPLSCPPLHCHYPKSIFFLNILGKLQKYGRYDLKKKCSPPTIIKLGLCFVSHLSCNFKQEKIMPLSQILGTWTCKLIGNENVGNHTK